MFIFRQLSHWVLLKAGHKRKCHVTYCIHCCQMLQNKHINMAEIRCKISFVSVQIKLQGARNVTWVLQEYLQKARLS
jgi:hypothetical protein